jgi:hypothetical protein
MIEIQEIKAYKVKSRLFEDRESAKKYAYEEDEIQLGNMVQGTIPAGRDEQMRNLFAFGPVLQIFLSIDDVPQEFKHRLAVRPFHPGDRLILFEEQNPAIFAPSARIYAERNLRRIYEKRAL